MAIQCPYCAHSMSVKTPKPGRYKPKCAKCAGHFLLSVSADDPPALKATALPNAGQPSPEATAPPADPEATSATLPEPPPRKKAVPLDATAAPAEGVSGAGNADFSVAASAVQDATLAEAGAGGRSFSEATEAGDSGPMPKPEEFRDPAEVPPQLGGYQVVKELGRGGMGAVYLARQVSLDRPVALKVMNPEWAANPNFLMRFTREAYAAAQLVHHNVVQVYDIGNDQGLNYFSMEFVEGKSLGDVAKEEILAPDVAAGYALQAARGLKFAHDRGMIHRDIKPDNLMLNTAGVVKVADLGLVRTPGMEEQQAGTEERQAIDEAAIKARASTGRTLASLSGVTMAGQAMGTPAYMAPEQARDATKCDHRADIYSLGCTLYVLVTGKPVFSGRTPMEVMTRHATDAPKPPVAVNKDVPKALSDVILKMIAKKPEERYQTMDDVVKALEDFLGLHGAGKQAATEQHLRTLETGVKAFNGVGLATIRDLAVPGFLAGCFLLGLLLLFTSWPTAGSFFLALGLFAGFGYFAVHGAMERSPLFLKARDVAGGASWLDLGKLAGGLVLLMLVLFVLGQLAVWTGAAVLGVGLAFGIHYGMDKPIAAKRVAALDKVDRMLKTLRLRGLSEEALEEFVAKYAGDHWEEFYEALFGYEKKMQA
ncbi:MAG: protein kinase, partial [Gemmataceae bacterium]|nr:protein kinase [Gemmataceae bacterium]